MQVASKRYIVLVAVATDSDHNQTSVTQFIHDTVEDAKEHAETLLMDDAYGDGGRVYYYTQSVNECTHDAVDKPVDAPEEE